MEEKLTAGVARCPEERLTGPCGLHLSRNEHEGHLCPGIERLKEENAHLACRL